MGDSRALDASARVIAGLLATSGQDLYLYLEPLATVALAVPLLGEPFGPFIALGGALVLTGVFVGQRPGPPRRAR